MVQVGDGSVAGAGFVTVIAADLSRGAQLVKSDAGMLILPGNNSYSSGTAIHGRVL